MSSIPPARAQPPITIVTSFGPASAAGIVARHLAGEFTAMLGAPVAVKNTTGAAGTIAAKEVVRARPGGNSLRRMERSADRRGAPRAGAIICAVSSSPPVPA